MESCVSCLCYHRLHSVYDYLHITRLKPTNVIQTRITKRTFCPITPMRQHHLIPSTITPQSMHRIRSIHKINIFSQIQSSRRRRWQISKFLILLHIHLRKLHSSFFQICRAQHLSPLYQSLKRQLSIVKRNIVHIPEYPSICHLTQFCIHISTSHHNLNSLIFRLYILRTFQSCQQITREWHRNPHPIWFHLLQLLLQQLQHQFLYHITISQSQA